jgi:TPP-dependent pyruvate/acetoin dehydrogenase alpha subunit
MKYRSPEEMAQIRERDPILQTERYLLKNKIYTQKQLDEIRAELQGLVDKAADEADAAPQPETGNITRYVFSEQTPFFEEKEPIYVRKTTSMVEAINRALRESGQPKIVMGRTLRIL